MCFIYGTLERGRLIMEGQPISEIADNTIELQLQREVAAGVYANAAIWHPIVNEVLTFGATRTEDIIRTVTADWRGVYPPCDISEAVGDVFNLLRPGDYTLEAQTTQLALLEEGKPSPHDYLWRRGELASLLLWVRHFREELPLTNALFDRIPVVARVWPGIQQEIAFRQHLKRVKARMKELQAQANEWKFERTTLINLDVSGIRHLLVNGYTLSQCRPALQAGSPETAPYRSPDNWSCWQEELKSLPMSSESKAEIQRLCMRYRKPSRRSKAVSRKVSSLLKTLDTALPLIRHVWPEVSIVTDAKQVRWNQLNNEVRAGNTLYNEMYAFYAFGQEDKVADLITRAAEYLTATGAAISAPMRLAA